MSNVYMSVQHLSAEELRVEDVQHTANMMASFMGEKESHDEDFAVSLTTERIRFAKDGSVGGTYAIFLHAVYDDNQVPKDKLKKVLDDTKAIALYSDLNIEKHMDAWDKISSEGYALEILAGFRENGPAQTRELSSDDVEYGYHEMNIGDVIAALMYNDIQYTNDNEIVKFYLK